MNTSNIAVIYMGGTFGSIGQPLYPMPALDFIDKLQALCLHHYDSNLHFFQALSIKDSSELTASDWLKLTQQILQLARQFQHFIIIHGTDTLHYAAAFLSHCFADRLRIIVTGSQYPLLEQSSTHLHPDSDAWLNFQFSLKHIQQIPKGCFIAFDGQLHHANLSIKAHTTEFNAFHSNPAQRSCSSVVQDINAIKISAWIDQVALINIVNLYCTPSSPDLLAKQLQALIHQPPQLLILQTFGAGNLAYSASLKSAIEDLLAKKCWVIISSQVLFGELSNQYAVAAWLAELGVVIDPHYSQADLYARAVLLYLQFADQVDWQQHWTV
ncbi:L-asparaginase [Acinetobacter marinus]|uniref:L-asparaginase n=1 Tax=Acinetobacter marinus TaxID=281375 RepID=A0A1G6N643_9GAMM|nr:asparaginase domain-containing protein [Acinetobacter marinus]SDC63338.1 L-asparaginase [Acinetobacter marinus]